MREATTYEHVRCDVAANDRRALSVAGRCAVRRLTPKLTDRRVEPGTHGARRLRPPFSVPDGLAHEVILVAAAMVAYFVVRNLTVGGVEEAIANAERIVVLEERMHVDWEDGVQASIVGSDTAVMLANWIYIWGHWPVILGTAIVLYLRRPDRYYLLRNALFVSGAVGFLFFALVPVAPPRLLDLGLVDTVTEQSQAYRALQPPGLTNQFAAFPSLHLGWNLAVGIVLLTTTTHVAVRLFAVVFPLAMGFAVIATANHFVLDVAGGIVVVLVGLAVAHAMERQRGVATLGDSGSDARSEISRTRATPVSRRASRRQRARRPAGS